MKDELPSQPKRMPIFNLSLDRMPFVGSVMIILMMVGLNVAAFVARQEIREANLAVEATFGNVVLANEAVTSTLRAQSAYRAFLLTGEAAFLEQYQANVDTYVQQWQALIDQTADAGQAELWRGMLENLGLRREQVNYPGIALRQQVNDGAATVQDIATYMANEPGEERLETIRDLITRANQVEQARLQQRTAEADQASANLQSLLIGVGISFAVLGLLFTWYVARFITTPLATIGGVARQLAEGRLDRRTGIRRQDELGQLAGAVDLMAERVQHLLQDKDEALRTVHEHEAVLRAVIDSVSVGITMTDRAGKIVILNPVARDLYQIDAQDLAGIEPGDLSHFFSRIFAESGKQLLAHMDLAMYEFDETVLTVVDQVQPEPRQLEIFSAPVYGHDGERLGRIFVQRDVTRERAIDRMKTEFVSMVSHELRTPLTSIKGYVDLLREEEVGELTSEQHGFLGIVATSTDRLVALINDLLDISRIESGKIELKRDRIDLIITIQAVVASFRPQIDAKQQRLTMTLPPEPLLVVGDSDRLTQILTNLLSNAHKYTPPQRDLAIVAQQQGDQVEVQVVDTGIGISQAEQAQLFTRFYRSTDRVVQEAGGTGLGLTITRSLVELHGGTISVRSSPGQGSTFSFTLPSAASGVVPPAVDDEEGRQRILVVEDEPDIAGLLRRFLERAGHSVTIAATAEDGFRQARKLIPDLITLDVHLPDVDGFTLLEWLRRDQATRDIPVVMVSIAPDEGQGQLLGAIDHLTKPVHEATLLDRVQQILARDGRATILVAEDDGDTRRLIVALLRRAGHRTIEASDGAEAIAAAQRQTIQLDLALIDVRMPGTDGLAALRALRGDPRTRDLPILMMTASNGVETNRADIESLGATLLRKPLAASDLAAAISGALERRDL